MEYTTLGRTGLKVSVAGLGCGGFSRLGLGTGKSEADAIGIIHAALDLGVNLFDTAAAYGTESVLGKALREVARDEVVICTKAPFGISAAGSSPERAVASLDRSLQELGTDYIDVYQLHGVAPAGYRHAVEVIAPALHMMHQSARAAVFPLTREHGVGTLLMFAVRNIFSRPERLAATMRELADDGELPRDLADNPDPLGFLVHDNAAGGGASSVVDAAYRFVRHEPGVDVVLFGTGEVEHLHTNIASLLKPPLPEADRDRLARLFGHLLGVGLDAPHLSPRTGRVTNG
jgi:L-galactose dehydrogenase